MPMAKAIREMEDQRALAYPDEPHSAYCRVCWTNIYVLYIDEDNHHGGLCPDGHTRADDCPHACAAAFNTRQIRRAMDEWAARSVQGDEK